MAAQQVCEEFSKLLGEIAYNEYGIIGTVLTKLEQSTKIKRDHFVHGAITLFVAYLILGHGAEFVCNASGFVYPAYASVKMIQTADKTDDTQWLTYWIVFGFLSVLEFASAQIVGWFPLYWLAKFLFLLWLYLPMTEGARIVYDSFIAPLLEKYNAHMAEIRREIDQELEVSQIPDDCATDRKVSVSNGGNELTPGRSDIEQQCNIEILTPPAEKGTAEAIPERPKPNDSKELMEEVLGAPEDNALVHLGDGDLTEYRPIVKL